MSVGHAVAEYGVCDALTVEPVGHVMSLVSHGQGPVGSSRTGYNGHSVSVLCGIDCQYRFFHVERTVFYLLGHFIGVRCTVGPYLDFDGFLGKKVA